MSEYRDFTEDEIKWVKRLRRVMKDAPTSLFLFTNGVGIEVYTKGSEGRYMTDSGSVDQFAPNMGIPTNIDHDGGDY